MTFFFFFPPPNCTIHVPNYQNSVALGVNVQCILELKNRTQFKQHPDMNCYARRSRIYSMQDKGWHGHRPE